MFDTPVAFIIFNRPDATAASFAAIAKAKPKSLFIIADGPRHESDVEKCEMARRVVERVDWDCEVHAQYATENLGCKRRVASGIDWVFKNCDEAIILEDDCVADPSFFPYCSELLVRHRDDERVMTIAGTQFHPIASSCRYSYYFSSSVCLWGWATWARAWKLFDVDMTLWPTVRDDPGFYQTIEPPAARDEHKALFESQYKSEIDTWDNQWAFASLAHGGLTITPVRNMITNTGFGADATHTVRETILAYQPTDAMPFPLVHPPYLFRCPDNDLAVYRRARSAVKAAIPLLRFAKNLVRRLPHSAPGSAR